MARGNGRTIDPIYGNGRSITIEDAKRTDRPLAAFIASFREVASDFCTVLASGRTNFNHGDIFCEAIIIE